MGRTKRSRSLRKKRNFNLMPDSQVHHDLIKFMVDRGWRNVNKLTVSSFLKTERGLYAKQDLMPNDMIIEIPVQCLISYWTIEIDDNFINLFDRDKVNGFKQCLSFQALLAFYLSYQVMQKEQSNWLAYINSLPKDFTMPYFCKMSELYHLPDLILEKVVEQNSTIKSSYQQLISLLNSNTPKIFDIDLFKYSYFICNSRTIYIHSNCLEPLVDRDLFFKELLSDEANMALAPMLDLLNHSDRAVTKFQLSHSLGFIKNNIRSITKHEVALTYSLFSSNSWKKYEEIFINYGTYNNTKLLLEYGFILPKNGMDFLEFTLEEINSYIKSHNELRLVSIPKHKYKFIRDHNLDQQMYVDRNDGLNHNFQAVLAILLLPQNIYNLTQIAFGDELSFMEIKFHAIEIIKNKKNYFASLSKRLEITQERSSSAEMCLRYFAESQSLLNDVLCLIREL